MANGHNPWGMTQDEVLQWAEQGMRLAPLEKAVEAMVQMLEDGEWAEHVSAIHKHPLASRLEDSITELHNEIGEEAATAQAAPAGAWIERWYGSGGKDGYEGWSIVNKDGRCLVAYLGRNVESGAVTEIVMAHNATLATTTAQAAPAADAVAGPVETIKFSDDSTADPVEKARRYLNAMADHRINSQYFFDDGWPKKESAIDAMATLAVLEQLAAAPTPAAQANSQPAPQGETNAQLDTDSNPTAPGQQRDMACSLALGQPMGNGQDQAAGNLGAQGDKLLTVAERNIRSFLRSAPFKSESDREAALNCVDVLWEAARAPADRVPAPVAAHVVADALADSQYLAGVSAGWNAANADDPNAALQKLHESRAGYLKPLSAARKQGGTQ